MTYEIRTPVNYSFGTLSSPAAISDTTLNSAEFSSRIPTGLSTTVYVPITLQNPSTGEFEIVWVNSHGAGATSLTVVRAKEGSTAKTWPQNTLWTCSPTLRDGVLPVSTRANLPADPHAGLRAMIQDEQYVVEWLPSMGWFSPVKKVATRLVSQSGAITGLVGTTEESIAKLAITGVRTQNGKWYRFDVSMAGDFTQANDSYSVRIRKDTNVGTTLISWPWITKVSGFTHYKTFSHPWKATADNASTNFYVTIQRIAGSGTATIIGERRASFDIFESGDPAVHAEVA